MLDSKTALLLLKYFPINDSKNIDEMVNIQTTVSLESRELLVHALKKQTYWPQSPSDLIRIYRIRSDNSLFSSEREKVRFVKQIIKALRKETDSEKLAEMMNLVFSGGRIHSPTVRESAQKLWARAIKNHLGLDNGTDEYYQEIEKWIQKTEAHVDGVDRSELFALLGEQIEAQDRCAQRLKESLRVDLSSYLKKQTKGVSAEAILYTLIRTQKERREFIDFLNRALNPDSIRKFIEETRLDRRIKTALNFAADGEEFIFILSRTQRPYGLLESEEQEKLVIEGISEYLSLSHKNFWIAPFTVRIGIMERLLFGDSKSSQYEGDAQAFEEISRPVLDQIFPDDMKYADIAKKLFSDYLRIIPPYQRNIFLTAALVAAHEQKGYIKPSLGRSLARLLSLIGPGETKLGQGFHSHPDTPEEIRNDMGFIKSKSDVPLRWDLMSLIERNVPQEVRDRMRIGKILGAASYFIVVEVKTLESGKWKKRALALLRPKAHERALRGFRIMDQLAAQQEGELATQFREILRQARESARIETDMELNFEQHQVAGEIYKNQKIRVNGEEFSIHPVEILEFGPNYRLMTWAPGTHFNDLPEKTETQLQRKQQVARTMTALIFKNLLSGKSFDHDIHGAQVRIHRNRIHSFDFGAFSLTPPTPAELESLANVISKGLKKTDSGELAFRNVMKALETQAREEPGSYITRVRRALLAAHDFIRYIPGQETLTILKTLVTSGKINPTLMMQLFNRLSEDAATLAPLTQCESDLTLEMTP